MTAVDTAPTTTNPFVGPHALSETDPLFGRDVELRRLHDLLVAERILLLYSPSGAGKTSLLHAGLKPELRRDGFAVLPTIRVTHEPPDALAGLPVRNRYALSTVCSLEAGRTNELDPRRLAEITLDEYLDETRENRAADGQDCLFFDQFEELFTADPVDIKAKRAFLAEVGDALRNRGRWAVFSMREDFAAHLDPHLKLLPTRLRTTFRLDLLGEKAAKEAIQRTMAAGGVTFDDAAAQNLVDDLRRIGVPREPGGPPELGLTVEPVQLQVVCHRLWSLLDGATEIRPEHLVELGNVDHALRDFYRDVAADVAATTGVREQAIRTWISDKLITEQNYRAQVQFGPPGDDRGLVLPALENAHLVRADSRRNTTWYELAHDRLVDPIRDSNEEWLDEHLNELQRGARVWEQARRSDRALYVGDQLQHAAALALAHPDDVGDSEREFLARCRDEQAQREKDERKSRWINRLAIAAAIGLVLALALMLIAVWQWRQVVEQKDRAEQVERSLGYFFGGQSEEFAFAGDLRQPLLLDALSLDELPDDETPSRFVLREINTHRFEDYMSRFPIGPVPATGGGASAMSADGRFAAVATAAGVEVIDLDGEIDVRTIPVQSSQPDVDMGEVVALSPDGSLLAYAPADGVGVQLWDVDGATLRELEARDSYAWGQMAFIGGGLLSASNGAGVAVWDTVTGADVTPPALRDQAVGTVVLSTSGRAAAVDAEGTLHVVDVPTGTWLSSIEVGEEHWPVGIDPSGDRVFITTFDRLRVLDAASGEPVSEEIPTMNTVVAAAVRGDVVATVDSTCQLRQWSLNGAAEPVTDVRMLGCRSAPSTATFSTDGGRVLVEEWLDTGRQSSVVAVDGGDVLWSTGTPEGTIAAGGSLVARIEDGRVVLRDTDGDQVASTSADDGVFEQVAMDSRGETVVASSGTRVVLVDAATAAIGPTTTLPWVPEHLVVGGVGADVTAAVSSSDGDVLRWRPGSPEPVTAVPTDVLSTDDVTRLAVTGSGSWVVVASHDELLVHDGDGEAALTAVDGEITRLATGGESDAVAVVVPILGPAEPNGVLPSQMLVWADERVDRTPRTIELQAEPEAITMSGRYLLAASGMSSDVYDLQAILGKSRTPGADPLLVGGHDSADYVFVDGLALGDVAIDESGATTTFVWAPLTGRAFEFHVEPAAIRRDIDRTAVDQGWDPLTDDECERTAGIPCP